MLNELLAHRIDPTRNNSIAKTKLLHSQVLPSFLPLKTLDPDTTSQSKVLFLPEPSHPPRKSRKNTEKEKERARKYQRCKRHKERARRRASKSASDGPGGQQSTPLPDNDPDDSDWYWSAEGGWVRDLVLLDDGATAMGTYWSSRGGYLNKNIPLQDFSSTDGQKSRDGMLAHVEDMQMEQKDGTNDPTTKQDQIKPPGEHEQKTEQAEEAEIGQGPRMQCDSGTFPQRKKRRNRGSIVDPLLAATPWTEAFHPPLNTVDTVSLFRTLIASKQMYSPLSFNTSPFC
jgi:hypothetical protein